jgi:transcriptional regulator with XRE-family HTH domain
MLLRHDAGVVRLTRANPKPIRRPTFMRAWRESRGWKQDDLVERLEALANFTISSSQLSRIENGKQAYNQDLLEALATVYGCDPSDIIRRDPGQPDAPRSILDTLKPLDRERIVKMIEAFRGSDEATGTEG